MAKFDQPIEPQDVLDRAEDALTRLRRGETGVSSEECRLLRDLLGQVQQYTASEKLRLQAQQTQRDLADHC